MGIYSILRIFWENLVFIFNHPSCQLRYRLYKEILIKYTPLYSPCTLPLSRMSCHSDFLVGMKKPGSDWPGTDHDRLVVSPLTKPFVTITTNIIMPSSLNGIKLRLYFQQHSKAEIFSPKIRLNKSYNGLDPLKPPKWQIGFKIEIGIYTYCLQDY